MSLPTPNYKLTQDYQVGNWTQSVTLEAGTFVRPIEEVYVPTHVKSKYPLCRGEVYCYTPKGILPIPERMIRKT